jgi:hypothetical protein
MIKIKNTEIQHLLGGYDFEVTIAMLPCQSAYKNLSLYMKLFQMADIVGSSRQ